MLKVYDFEQGTEEWFAAKRGKASASEASTVMAKGKGGSESITRKKYAYKLAAERISDRSSESFSNAHTDRGHVDEPVARELYELKTGNNVTLLGFGFNGVAGASPDGLVGDDGGVEIKSKKFELHLECLLEDKVDREHVLQMQTNMWVWGRKWWDFVSYCEGLPLYVKRFERDELMIKEIKEAFTSFNNLVDQVEKEIMRKF